jgi:maltooligosyltrehalose synthase
LHRLLERQHYRLAWWRTAADEVNWRRFFDVSTLGGMRVERPEVFEASHALIFKLFTEGLIDGVRIDHVDGLAEPREYCQRLRARLEELAEHRPEELKQDRTYFVVEKILARGEPVRDDWRIDGTTGYDFMNDVGALLHDPRGAEPLGKTGPNCLDVRRTLPMKPKLRGARSWPRTCPPNWTASRERCIGSHAIRPSPATSRFHRCAGSWLNSWCTFPCTGSIP